jgi:3-oxoacyl-[acyl-carrier-protein] synthase-3
VTTGSATRRSALRGPDAGPHGYATIGPPAMVMPETVVGNREIEERLGVKEGWIEARTGIRERRRAGPDERLASAAAEAGRLACERAGLTPADLDLICVSTMSPDRLSPNVAPVVAAELDANHAAAMDVGSACAGFISSMALATGTVESGRARHALVIGADFMSRILDRDDRRTAGLFADGVGAVTLSGGGPELCVGPVVLRTDPEGQELVYVDRRPGFIYMDGQETYRIAVDRICEAAVDAADLAGAALDEIDLFVFHQANLRILRGVAERLGADRSRVVDCIARFGNTSAASIPIALSVAYEEGRLEPGSTILFGAIGAGFTYGAFVARWGRG